MLCIYFGVCCSDKKTRLAGFKSLYSDQLGNMENQVEWFKDSQTFVNGLKASYPNLRSLANLTKSQEETFTTIFSKILIKNAQFNGRLSSSGR